MESAKLRHTTQRKARAAFSSFSLRRTTLCRWHRRRSASWKARFCRSGTRSDAVNFYRANSPINNIILAHNNLQIELISHPNLQASTAKILSLLKSKAAIKTTITTMGKFCSSMSIRVHQTRYRFVVRVKMYQAADSLTSAYSKAFQEKSQNQKMPIWSRRRSQATVARRQLLLEF